MQVWWSCCDWWNLVWHHLKLNIFHWNVCTKTSHSIFLSLLSLSLLIMIVYRMSSDSSTSGSDETDEDEKEMMTTADMFACREEALKKKKFYIGILSTGLLENPQLKVRQSESFILKSFRFHHPIFPANLSSPFVFCFFPSSSLLSNSSFTIYFHF